MTAQFSLSKLAEAIGQVLSHADITNWLDNTDSRHYFTPQDLFKRVKHGYKQASYVSKWQALYLKQRSKRSWLKVSRVIQLGVLFFSVSSWARPDLFRLALLSGTGTRVQLGRNLRLGHLLSQLSCLFMVAIGDGLVQPVHDADRILWTAGWGRNALKTHLLDIETFWQRLDQKLAYQEVFKCNVVLQSQRWHAESPYQSTVLALPIPPDGKALYHSTKGFITN